MNKKNLNIIVCMVTIFFIMFSSISLINRVYADNSNFDFNKFDKVTSESEEAEKVVNKIFQNAVIIMRFVCLTIGIVMLLVIAMKYMISSAGDRADIKKHAINYVIAALIFFGTTGILEIINSFVSNFQN